MTTIRAKFYVGQLVYHKRFDYRGVVVDVDPQFQGDDEWYEVMARSRPPKDKPWYHVLVHNAEHSTYVSDPGRGDSFCRCSLEHRTFPADVRAGPLETQNTGQAQKRQRAA